MDEHFPGFDYSIGEIAKYICNLGMFTIALKNTSKTVFFEPKQPEQFKKWLDAHGIENIGAPKIEYIYLLKS